MKKRFFILVSILALSLALVACTTGNGEKADLTEESQLEEEEAEKTKDLDPIEENKTLTIKATDKLDLEDYNLVDGFDYDFDKDGRVELYTKAELDENGNPMLDDGQDWLLIAKTQEATYNLFQDYIQLGKIDFNGFTVNDDFFITIKVSGTANINFGEFKYDKEKKEFIYTEKYSEVDNVNMIYEY